METFKSVVDTLCQPKVLAMLGVLVLIVASFTNNNNASETGVFLIMAAGVWGYYS